jgi:hypothetical protein
MKKRTTAKTRDKKNATPTLPEAVKKLGKALDSDKTVILQNDKTGMTMVAVEINLGSDFGSKLREVLDKVMHGRILKCAECGEDRDCRPFGAKGAEICYPCACKPENRERSKHNCGVRNTGEGELM